MPDSHTGRSSLAVQGSNHLKTQDANSISRSERSVDSSGRPNLEPTPVDTFRVLERELLFARTMTRPIVGTISLLVAIGVVFLAAVLASELLSNRLAERIPYELVVVLGAKNNRAISDGAVWRLGTHMLLHGGALHLLINAYALYVLGSVLEKLYGARRFLVLFFVSGLAGAGASYWLTEANSVGASGAIFGVLGAAVVFGFKFRGILPARIRHLLTVGLLPWVAINIFIGMAFERIDNAAHMGGMVGGALVALVLGTQLEARESRVAVVFQWLILAAVLVFLVYSVVAFASYGNACGADVEHLEACFDVLLVPQ